MSPQSFFRAAVLGVVFALSLSVARANLKLAAIFGNNMVLQQGQPVPVWGWADSGTTVSVHFAGQTVQTQADASGRWLARLAPLTASSEPRDLVVEAGETLTRTNVVVGEVWLASGQSNMEKPIGLQPGQKPCLNYTQELAAANYPLIRLFKVEKKLSATPITNLLVFRGWEACRSNSLNGFSFSAAAYFFGREIHTNLNVPVGLIESSWGGTRIEPWTPPAGFQQVPGLESLADFNPGTNKLVATMPKAIFNAMIAPLTGYAIRGALWYQGESNCRNAETDHHPDYADKMAALVGGWRQLWNQGDFPFFYVQIAPFKYHSGPTARTEDLETLPRFWAVQSRAYHQIPNSGMAVTTDLVDNLSDIHPRDKASVGHRLALLARHNTYHQDEVVCQGPVFDHLTVDDTKLVLHFAHADGGLRSRDQQPLTWFTLADSDHKFVPAQAQIVGDTVELTAPGVTAPVAARFAWSEVAQPNLCNGAGLPAEPFQTDANQTK